MPRPYLICKSHKNIQKRGGPFRPPPIILNGLSAIWLIVVLNAEANARIDHFADIAYCGAERLTRRVVGRLHRFAGSEHRVEIGAADERVMRAGFPAASAGRP